MSFKCFLNRRKVSPEPRPPPRPHFADTERACPAFLPCLPVLSSPGQSSSLGPQQVSLGSVKPDPGILIVFTREFKDPGGGERDKPYLQLIRKVSNKPKSRNSGQNSLSKCWKDEEREYPGAEPDIVKINL